MINLNPEDFVDKDLSFELCWKANEELISIVKENNDIFFGAVAMLPLNNISVWLHPVFDINKKDNNLIFSWEYEQSQAMFEIIMADIFVKYSKIKILSHHAGAMVPFFFKKTSTNNAFRKIFGYV